MVDTKIEPLKGKRQETDTYLSTGTSYHKHGWLFEDKDIRSAVEWLKRELMFFPVKQFDRVKIKRLIDEAFEDVTKK